MNFWINNKQEEEEEQHERYFSLIMKFLKIFAPATPTLQRWLAPDPLLLCWGIWRPGTCLTCHKWILVYSTFQGLTTKFPFCFSSCFCGIWGTVQFAFGLSVLSLSLSLFICVLPRGSKRGPWILLLLLFMLLSIWLAHFAAFWLALMRGKLCGFTLEKLSIPIRVCVLRSYASEERWKCCRDAWISR